jgi:hypothetical protein
MLLTRAATSLSRKESHRTGLHLVIILTCLLAPPSYAQISGTQYQGLFLVGRFGEVCTMCEVVVLCERNASMHSPAENRVEGPIEIPPTGAFSLYHFETRTFWSQIATIWEFFVANFSTDGLAARGHTRPVRMITVDDGVWAKPVSIEGRLILDPPIIELSRMSIDRTDNSWRVASNSDVVGFCYRLPLWESLELIEQHAANSTSMME